VSDGCVFAEAEIVDVVTEYNRSLGQWRGKERFPVVVDYSRGTVVVLCACVDFSPTWSWLGVRSEAAGSGV
jgi:hypothetical protein